jgi:hypothetical protein
MAGLPVKARRDLQVVGALSLLRVPQLCHASLFAAFLITRQEEKHRVANRCAHVTEHCLIVRRNGRRQVKPDGDFYQRPPASIADFPSQRPKAIVLQGIVLASIATPFISLGNGDSSRSRVLDSTTAF